MKKEQKDFLRDKADSYIKDFPYLSSIKDKVESISGIWCPSHDTRDEASNIIERGVLFERKRPKMMIGEASQCHANSSELFNLNKGKGLLIATGYALSEDGIWRQHSWCVFPNKKSSSKMEAKDWLIVETTEKRKKYFGYILNREESKEFYLENS